MARGRVVWILGAGASHDASFADDAHRPPLNAGFFRGALPLERDPAVANLLRKVIELYLPEHEATPIDQLGLESLVVGVHRSLSSGSFPTDTVRVRAAFDQLGGLFFGRDLPGAMPAEALPRVVTELGYRWLCLLVADVLRKSVAWTPAGTRAQCQHHRVIAAQLEPGDAVISFNYDVIADRALVYTGRGLHYGFEFPADDLSGEMVPVPLDSRRNLLLKLHGSLNWKELLGFRPDTWQFHRIGFRSRDLESIEGYVEDAQTAFAGPTSLVRAYAVPVPYLVMPLEDKRPILEARDDSHLFGMLEHPLTHVWELAEGVLREASEVIVAGYSVPAVDEKAVGLLRRAIPANLPTEKLTIVSNSAVGADGVEARLARAATKFSGGFSAYCRGRFGRGSTR